MLDRVLIPTDGSESANRAVSYAARLLRGTTTKVTLLTVFEEPVYPTMADGITPPVTPYPPYEELRETFLEQAESLLESGEAPLIEAGIEVERKVRFGNPALEIMQELEEVGYDLVIMGSRGHGVIGEVLLGSVSYRLTHHAKCPVLLVH